ncbi:MAG: GNAT family N-acetyltransferase [Acidobacteria bacterium]|jgi:predicted N-acetyltransferase YhbS|nr:GNAT family N-acetyltransferase [Acidobacteriota bacterium]
MQGSFAEDPGLLGRLMDLLDLVFPGLARGADRARILGAPWEQVSTPFIATDAGRLVSHVGLIELPLVIEGRCQIVGAIHGVATHPEHRRRGHYRRLMEEVLEHCQDRLPTQILTTEHPEYFTPFGFRVVPEHVFTVPSRRPAGPGQVRLLDLDDNDDVTLLHRLLESRTPVSSRLGVVREHGVFCFNEGRRPLHYAPDLDVVLCFEQENEKVTLYDVVGPELPPLDAVLDRLPGPVSSVTLAFAPDRLAPDATPVPGLFNHDGPSYLMVRGSLGEANEPFALPRPART